MARTIKVTSKEAVNKMVTAKLDDRRPGTTPDALRRRMSDLLAEEFSRVGEDLYDKAMASVTENVQKIFDTGVQELGSVIKQKLGELGYKESIRHVRPWLEGIISDLQTKGMPGLASSLGNITSEFSVKYQEGGEKPAETAPEGGEEEALLEVEAPTPEPKAEDVEEVSADDLTAILEGKEPAPAAGGEGGEKQESAASTFGDVRRRLRNMRKQRRVEADTRNAENK